MCKWFLIFSQQVYSLLLFNRSIKYKFPLFHRGWKRNHLIKLENPCNKVLHFMGRSSRKHICSHWQLKINWLKKSNYKLLSEILKYLHSCHRNQTRANALVNFYGTHETFNNIWYQYTYIASWNRQSKRAFLGIDTVHWLRLWMTISIQKCKKRSHCLISSTLPQRTSSTGRQRRAASVVITVPPMDRGTRLREAKSGGGLTLAARTPIPGYRQGS